MNSIIHSEMEEPLVHQGDNDLFAAAPSIDGGADDADLLIPIADDDADLLIPIADDDTDLLIPIAAIDEKYASKLQLQEVLVSSFLSTTNSNVHHDESPNIHFHLVDRSMVVHIDPKDKAVIESDSPSSSQDRSTANCGMDKAVIESDSPSSSQDRSKTANCGMEKAVIVSDSPSSSQDRFKTANCGICMEDKPVADFFEIGECKHEFCEECVGQYLAVKVEEKVAIIGCPEAGCGVRMEMERCQGILRPEVFERWGMAMCELMVEERFYCPYNDCSAMMMVDDGGEVIRASECPHCNRLFCAQCRVAWHGEIKCSDFQALGEGEREREDLLLRNVAKNCKWQRCPKCWYYVERIDGCMFIKCRCGHGFCYSCASPMGDDHYCAKCRR